MTTPKIEGRLGVNFSVREVTASPVLSIDSQNPVGRYVPLCQFNHRAFAREGHTEHDGSFDCALFCLLNRGRLGRQGHRKVKNQG
jgi:hypothetical protein